MSKARVAFSRRKLLAMAGGGGAVAAFAASRPVLEIATGSLRRLVARAPGLRSVLISLADADYAQWAQTVGSVFTIAGGTSMVLTGVLPLQSSGVRPLSLGRAQAFLAVFDVPGGRTLAGDLIYTVSHPQYGAFQIFLSAVTDPRTPGRMLAVYN